MKQLSLIAFGALTFALALASNTYAADGVVLINQSTSITGLPGCGSAGFPIVICQPGSYRLSGNLTVTDPTRDAIDINASNVTLDLNGFSVAGPSFCTGQTVAIICHGVPGTPETGIGITSANGSIGVSLTNGAVSGFLTGVSIQGRVDTLRATNNVHDGISVGNGSTLTASFASLNGGRGIVGTRSTIAGNVAINNFGDGINATQSTVANNLSTDNGALGLNVSCPSSVSGNTLPANEFGGMLTSGANCAFANNVP